MNMRWIFIFAMALVFTSRDVTPASDRKPLGEIDFFGYKNLDLAVVRSALPLQEGELFPPAKAKSSDDLKRQVSDKVKQALGREPTSVSFVCCDSKQHWMVYIGLSGESYQALSFNSAPIGNIRLPRAAVALRQELEKAWTNAVMKGNAAVDDSEGYTLMNDPAARRAELAIREYALRNEILVFQVLASSSDGRHRAIAAQMAGYGRQSSEQIDALVQASLDPDDNVRNDAVRALAVLAGAKPNLAQKISPEPFVRLLRSGDWSDHNKASILLLALTKGRDPKVLALLHADALDALVEMARWRNIGHAAAALSILGRIAGLDEDALNKLIDSGQSDRIIGELHRQ
jgi:hypothetical protein